MTLDRSGVLGFLGRLCVAVCVAGAPAGFGWSASRVMLGTSAMAAPEPDPVPRRWQLTAEPGPLRVASIDVQGVGPRFYYYMTYKVVNTSGQDLLFTPSFELATDEGDVLRSGRNVPSAVTRELLARLENPFLEDQISIIGMILQGEDNAREGLVIWPAPGNHVRSLDVFGMGFSGETRVVEVKLPHTPKVDAAGASVPAPAAKRISLRKTLMLRFQPLGEIRERSAEEFPLLEKLWVMR